MMQALESEMAQRLRCFVERNFVKMDVTWKTRKARVTSKNRPRALFNRRKWRLPQAGSQTLILCDPKRVGFRQ